MNRKRKSKWMISYIFNMEHVTGRDRIRQRMRSVCCDRVVTTDMSVECICKKHGPDLVLNVFRLFVLGR